MSFEYTYSAKQQEEVNKIRNKYLPKQEDKMEQLRKLDREAEKPGQIISITVGITGALILGIGMCCTMVWGEETSVFVAGVIVGIIGMVIAGVAYPLDKQITKRRREKIADRILALSDEISQINITETK